VGARGEIRERQEAAAPSDRGDSLEIKTGAEGAALTREHHGAQAPIILELRVRPGDRPKHSRIERVHLGRMIQPDIGDAVGDRKLDAILDTTLSFFSTVQRRGERTSAQASASRAPLFAQA
jgi:hypothetical protein